MLLAFLRKFVALHLIFGWAVLLVFGAVSPLEPRIVVSIVLFEVCLIGMAYCAARDAVWWQTRGPGRWER